MSGGCRPATNWHSARSWSATRPRSSRSSTASCATTTTPRTSPSRSSRKIYFSIRNFDFRSSLLTWIYKITVNECYDYLRKKRVRKLVYESDFSEEDASGWKPPIRRSIRPLPLDEQLAQRDLVVKLLSKVSEEDRSLILLKEVEGHSVEELAADDRIEREYNKGETVPDAAEAAQGGAAVRYGRNLTK